MMDDYVPNNPVDESIPIIREDNVKIERRGFTMFPSIPITRDQDEGKKGRGLTSSYPQSYEDSKQLYKMVMNRRIPTNIDYTKQPYLLEHPLSIPPTKAATKCCGFPVFGWLFVIIMFVLISSILIGIQ
jgi:hypothetical protein